MIDSFNSKSTDKNLYGLGPQPQISTIQKPHYYNGSIYSTGFILGEGSSQNNNNKYVLSKIQTDKIQYFVNYPEDYKEKNWGGIYYRMVYHCVVEDSLIYISFPGSNYIAKFNVKNNSTKFEKIYPDINSKIEVFPEKRPLTKNKIDIAKHYYGQLSFAGLQYDKYRRIFYRFLLLPSSQKNIKNDKLGLQKKIILVYDRNLNYLGFNELNDSFSSKNYFVNKKGLFIKYFKNKNDEDNIFFYKFVVDSSRIKLPKQ